jgi:hypothetical protein
LHRRVGDAARAGAADRRGIEEDPVRIGAWTHRAAIDQAALRRGTDPHPTSGPVRLADISTIDDPA